MQTTELRDIDQIEIRSATLEDAPAITKIWLQGIASASGHSGTTYEDALDAIERRLSKTQGKGGVWVAVSSQKVVGWQSLTDFGLASASRIVQSSTYIDRDWHSHGLGKRLLTYAQHCAQESDLDTIVGWIKTDNIGSIKLVTTLGWHFVGVLPRHSVTEPELAYYAYAIPRRR